MKCVRENEPCSAVFRSCRVYGYRHNLYAIIGESKISLKDFLENRRRLDLLASKCKFTRLRGKSK